MAKIFVLYSKPADTAAFDAYYFDKHVPLAKTLPGLRSMKSPPERSARHRDRPTSI
jgi:uncharacterized protein (TIGR02118 family)